MEWLVQAPIWVQMALLAVTALPAATVLGWLLMWGIDRLAACLVPSSPTDALKTSPARTTD
ncbi:hypothetical protein [uncultured Corynebacterium sp.]|uniref:hypothetical protein n=1 Tax=Corynebacterium sp. YSMAA5_1_F9 TaxID=3383591 RepID=UPI0025FEE261|nr:hypothetical protein [uncultured Corynebacterium sp.]